MSLTWPTATTSMKSIRRTSYPERVLLDSSASTSGSERQEQSIELEEKSTMLITVPDVLTASQIAHARQVLSSAEWVDGRVTAGYQSAQAKDNLQIPEGHPAALEIG